MKRTAKQTAEIVEKTITEIRDAHREANFKMRKKEINIIINKIKKKIDVLNGEIETLNGESKNFRNDIDALDKQFDEIISDTCKKYDITEKHIRTVAGWEPIE